MVESSKLKEIEKLDKKILEKNKSRKETSKKEF